jgi:hypothetical protein
VLDARTSSKIYICDVETSDRHQARGKLSAELLARKRLVTRKVLEPNLNRASWTETSNASHP